MNCTQAQAEFLDLARSGRPLSGALADHVRGCAECRRAWTDVSAAMAALDALPAVRMPDHVARSVRDRVLGDLAPPVARAWPAVALAVVLGLTSALLSLAVLGFRLDFSEQPGWVVATGGLAWAATFVLAFWMVLRPRPGTGDLRPVVLTGMGAMAVFMAADQLLPLTEVVDFCFRSSWAREHLGVLGLQGVFFAVGAAYALVPLFLLSWLTSRRYGDGTLKGGITAASMFFFLLAPAIFIQCHAFTVGALLAWMGGAVVGSVVGGVAGHWAARRVTA